MSSMKKQWMELFVKDAVRKRTEPPIETADAACSPWIPPADGQCHLLLLPDELIVLISNYLQVSDMQSFFATCKMLDSISRAPHLQSRIWEPQCMRVSIHFPTPDGDWKAAFGLNCSSNEQSPKCPDCFSWFVAGERHLHGPGLCYRCDVCFRSVTFGHRVTCARCKLCGLGFSPAYPRPCPKFGHPPHARVECIKCKQSLGESAKCECDESARACRSCHFETTSRGVCRRFCRAHAERVRTSCCDARVFAISCGMPTAKKSCQATRLCERDDDSEERHPLFFVLMSHTAYAGNR